MDFTEVIARPEVQEWLRAHAQSKPHDLALKKSPFADIPIQWLVQQIAGKQLLSKKIPFLSNIPDIIYPPKINIEQSSSWPTAQYKAHIVKAQKIADLTGGFGIDCMAFAQNAEKVIHIERNEDLQIISKHNFEVLGLKNISSFAQDGLTFITNFKEDLDLIYADPSRRDENKNKVFKLGDLSPTPQEILQVCQNQNMQILLKLSPMLDLTEACKTLDNIAEIHIVSLKNELKEILLLISPQEKITEPRIICANLESKQSIYEFSGLKDDENIRFSAPEKFIYKPNASLMKSGVFNRLGNDLGLKKLNPNTQLYTSEMLIEGFPGEVLTHLCPIKNPKKTLKNKSIRMIRRNFPADLSQIKKQYKCTSDGTEIVIFTRSIAGTHILSAEKI
uniref:methyltransferase n=1 Tax=Ornithobacterium rhinotracheale TaxID=28251 RepID=UPI0039A46F57